MFKKVIFEQEYQDYAGGIIEPRKFYNFFYILWKLLQILDGQIPKWTYLIKLIMVLCVTIALLLCSTCFYHGIDTFNIPLTTEAGTYVIVLVYKLLILVSTEINIPTYHKLQHAIEDDFLYMCTKGEKYRKRFFRIQFQTRKICKLTVMFVLIIAIAMTFFTTFFLFCYLLTHPPGEGNRPLMFPLWFFEIDLSATPAYEIAFIFTNIAVIAYAFNYSFMIGTQMIWIRHIACKADIVIWYLEDLLVDIKPTNNERERNHFDNLIRQRMKEIMQHHQSMNDLTVQFAQVYKGLLMFEQMFSAPVVCMCAYSASEKWEEGENSAVLLLLLTGTVTVLFVPSYMCTFLADKVTSICYACWNIPFWNASPVIKPYLLLIMMKSLRPLPLKVPGFDEFSVQTFSNKMASAYSFFNMLRQANKKKP